MECDVLNGRKVNLKATIEINVRLYSNDGISILKDINGISGIQKLNKIVQLNSMVGKNTTKAIAKENILLNSEEKVMEILKKEVRIINKDFKVSYNKVVAKAELSVNFIFNRGRKNKLCRKNNSYYGIYRYGKCYRRKYLRA